MGAEMLGDLGIWGGCLGDWKLRRNDRFTMAETGGEDAQRPGLAGRAGMGGGAGDMGLMGRDFSRCGWKD